ncbi:MAG TPA: DnaA N-terminal domain-containing protein, partial [Turneriella sp.]|nr:DnaA N-terminal domain-containing protein [Turneriella sp.]
MLNADSHIADSTDPLLLSSDSRLWLTLRDKLKKKLPSQVFQIFFQDIKAEIKGNDLILTAPSHEIAKHVQAQYARAIQDDAISLGFQGKIITTHTKQEKTPQPAATLTTPKAKPSEAAFPNRIDLNPHYTFDR